MNRKLKIFISILYFFSLVLEPYQYSLSQSGEGGIPALTAVQAKGNQVVLSLSQLMPYDVYTLENPDRMVIEIPGTRYKANFSRKKVQGEFVKRIRGYQFKETPLISRVVLDLTGPVDYRANADDSQVFITLQKNEVMQEQQRQAQAAKKKKKKRGRKRDLIENLPTEVVTLDFEGADIRDVIRLMSETSNINMIFGPEVGGTISIHLKKVPFNEAFQTILNLRGLVPAQLGSNVLRITTPDNLKQDKTKAIVYTKIIPVSYIDAEAMKLHLLAVMNSSGRKGTITVVNESNSLVITDSTEGLSQAERLISKLDVKPQQVLIEARMVEINLNNGFDIGVQWEYADINAGTDRSTTIGLRNDEDGRIQHGSGSFPQISVDDTGAAPPTASGTGVSLPGPTSAGITFGFLKDQQILTATLAALITKSRARVLSSPKIVTINGEQARIEAVQDIPFRTSTVSGTGVVSNSFENVSAGIILTVTPTINADNRITLKINPESSFPTQESTEAGPIIRSRTAETTVIIKNGETLVIGGLIDDQDTTGISKVPILGDIPILGAFFRNQTDRKIRNELLVFVTPRIIND